ncbi:MAG: DUF2953 domain-containing protein [Peptococcaceae bacterium]|nr:DUF2953 domain-containing protein [Peptococcaceae bacterium]
MSGVYLVMILVALVLLVLSLTRLRLRLYYRRRGKDDEVTLEFSIWRGLLCHRLEVPVAELKVKDDRPEPRPEPRPGPFFRLVPRPVFKIKAEVEGKGGRPVAGDEKRIPVSGPAGTVRYLCDTVRLVRKYMPAILFLLRRVRLISLQWRTVFGTGDPSQTGFLTGLAWGMKGLLLTAACRLLSPAGARPVVAVRPDFDRACFETELECIFEVRVGHIILTGFKALTLKFK